MLLLQYLSHLLSTSLLTPLTTSCFVDGFSSLKFPGATKIFDIVHSDGSVSAKERATLHVVTTSSTPQPPEIVTFPAADKKTKLYGAVFRPLGDDVGEGPFPTVVYMYGGPHVQLVRNYWRITRQGSSGSSQTPCGPFNSHFPHVLPPT